MKFKHFWPKNDGEKWSRINIFEIPPCAHHVIFISEFNQKYKFSNKNNMVSAWRNFKNIFPTPLFIIIFRPEMLKFHPYFILTGDTRVEFVIYCVLSIFEPLEYLL